jgi:hypothetical protein
MKDAGVLLYALRIASGNLKTMQAEKAKPTQMVTEPEKAGETPMGMTPWSASGEGHDPEAGEEEEEETIPPASPGEVHMALNVEERVTMRRDYERQGLIRPGEIEAYFDGDAPDPLLVAINRRWAERECRAREQEASLKSAGEQELPPGSIQACRASNARMGRR